MSVISIKGVRDVLLVSLNDDAPWDEVSERLFLIIEQRNDFFRGARIAIKVGDRALNRDDIRKLQDKLAEHDVHLASILGDAAETIRAARRAGIDTDLPEGVTAGERDDSGELPPLDSSEHGTGGVLVKNTLRSGRIVRHVGHVVVIGDVNPGAQIIAGGDVLVWGRLRGTVHAGANGDESALVCALDMRPMQLRIANYVAIAGDDGHRRPHPEYAMVRDGQIVAEEWGSN